MHSPLPNTTHPLISAADGANVPEQEKKLLSETPIHHPLFIHDPWLYHLVILMPCRASNHSHPAIDRACGRRHGPVTCVASGFHCSARPAAAGQHGGSDAASGLPLLLLLLLQAMHACHRAMPTPGDDAWGLRRFALADTRNSRQQHAYHTIYSYYSNVRLLGTVSMDHEFNHWTIISVGSLAS